ncbi:SNF1-interacting protein [Neonectria magnoliae]|uniref:SNF1-interacting protein n=1 Tax=Neonectria magnoliae TaxID=2732573 RepID=A0ABR1HVS0_9HYPO
MPEPTGSTAPAPAQPSSAIPVGLNEAALDSPTFRVTAANFAEQVDAIERWLNGYVSSTSRLLHDFLTLEETINTYLAKTVPTAADGVVDNDYTFLALKRVGDGWRDYWMHMLSNMKKMDGTIVEPIRNFITGDLRHFKECRKALDNSQRIFDSTLARYVSQSKTKEPSALREDAFAVYETRKVYLKSAMDYCQLAPQLRFTMDKLIIKICTERWKEMKRSRDAGNNANKWNQEMDRIHGWSKEMEASEGTFRRELQVARRDLGESALAGFKPSRELEDYSTSTVPFLGSRGPVNIRLKDGASVVSEKQGWLFLRTLSGKPARHTWVRRWYYCRDGIFGWLIPGPLGVLQGDEIGVLLCNAKPAVGEERRFCFEVKTKSQTILLQTETQGELTEWLEVFEVTKKRAFENTMNRPNTSVSGVVDPAFSITPPSIPEFSAKTLDAQPNAPDESGPAYDRSSTLPVPGPEGGLSTRQSFDINGSLTRRSITALGRDLAREEGESGREHAARIIQRLDLHRKATFGSINVEAAHGSAAVSSPGAAGLISSTNSLLPGYPNTFAAPSSPRQMPNMLPAMDTLLNTLAPSTLAKPPSMTALSRIAVMTAGERRPVGNNRKLPASVVANYWGSNVWGAISSPPQPVLPRLDDDDPIGVVVPGSSQASLGKGLQRSQSGEVFPRNYPPELRAQHAQFRLLFPDAPLEEKLVLVFCAAWNSAPSQGHGKPDMAGDGRIYVTPDNMYFYGQQIGLVTAYSISLDIITEVTAAPGKDCDFIFLHLGDDANETGYTRITIKVFLEKLGLLHTRLNLLVDDLQAEEPMEVEAIIAALINLEKEEFDRPSPSVESWEEVSAETPIDDGTSSGRPVGRRHDDFSSHLRPSKSRARPDHKLHLPTQTVVYEPEGMTEMAAERTFELSAKACFHVLFGDKSFVFPKLYFERRAQQIAQGPWVLVDQGRMRRDFQFKVDYKDVLGRSKTADVDDYQVIEIFSDHVTYVVTHVKTAWHLPHSSWFKVITKIVITHVAKSKCKLAVYTKIDWSKLPTLSKNLVERQALHDAASDAEELAEVATDQVRKLGARSRTNRAIQVYGQIGQQTEVVVFSPGTKESTKKQVIKPRTLTAILFETLRSFGESAVSSLIMGAIAVLRKLFSVITAHGFILGLLAFSTLANLLITSSEVSTWWGERRAAGFMQNIGIRPNTMMSRAIYIADLGEASGAAGQELSFPQNSTCFDTFRELLEATDMDSPWEDAGAALSSPSSQATARRLRRTRQRLGSYRHDLLVAMRVVNSVEREMLQSEWENWLIDEKSLCDDLDVVLRSQSDKKKDDNKKKRGGSPQKVMEAMSSERRRELEEWRDSHCGSCRIDHQIVMRERKLTMV